MAVSSPAELSPEERIANYRRNRDPDAMWPGTTDRDRAASYREMVSATRLILRGHTASLTGSSETEVRSAGVSAFMSGLGPLLGWWIERGLLQAPPPLANHLREHLAHGRRRASHMAERLGRTARALRERGVVPTVLKGTHTARRFFEDPGTRPTADIDLLVQPGQAVAAAEALTALGLRKVSFHTVPYREDWGPTGHPRVYSAEMSHENNPWTVDLHYTLDRLYSPGLVARFDSTREGFLEPWASPAGPVTVLRQPWLMTYLALHAAADFPHVPLIRIVELIFALRADVPAGTLSWKSLAGALRQLELQRLAYPAFALAADLAPDDIDPAFLRELSDDTTARMRHIVPMVLETPAFARLSFQMRLVWAKGPWEVFRNLLEWIYPEGPLITPWVRVKIGWRRLLLLLRGQIGIAPRNGNGRD